MAKKPKPSMLGSGMAKNAGSTLRGRAAQIDAASGFGPKSKPKPKKKAVRKGRY